MEVGSHDRIDTIYSTRRAGGRSCNRRIRRKPRVCERCHTDRRCENPNARNSNRHPHDHSDEGAGDRDQHPKARDGDEADHASRG